MPERNQQTSDIIMYLHLGKQYFLLYDRLLNFVIKLPQMIIVLLKHFILLLSLFLQSINLSNIICYHLLNIMFSN